MKRILYIEDSCDDFSLVKKAISRLNLSLELDLAENAENALTWLRATSTDPGVKPCAILVDLNLPDMSGHDLISEIKKLKDIPHYPIIVFSTSDDDRDIIRAYSVGANAYLIKPLSFKELLLCIESIFNFWCLCNSNPPKNLRRLDKAV